MWRTVSHGATQKEEGAAEICDELTTVCATGEEEVEKLGVKMSSEREESFGEGVFNFFLFLIILL